MNGFERKKERESQVMRQMQANKADRTGVVSDSSDKSTVCSNNGWCSPLADVHLCRRISKCGVI